MSGKLPRSRANRLLGRLAPNDLALLQPNLKQIDLPLRKQLERPNGTIEQVYFLESGFASVVAYDAGGRGIEVGLIGREGMTGLAVVMGADRSPHETFIQSAGNGFRIPANVLRKAIEESRTLHRTFLLYAHTFTLQTSYTAMSNGRSGIEERLARWILMAHDRIGGPDIPLTHEFLALMLGVRRSGVTVALKLLEGLGLIRTHRGIITILDRKGLERLLKGTYGLPEAEYLRLIERP